MINVDQAMRKVSFQFSRENVYVYLLTKYTPTFNQDQSLRSFERVLKHGLKKRLSSKVRTTTEMSIKGYFKPLQYDHFHLF